MNDADRTEVLLEDIQDKLARLTEALADVPKAVRTIEDKVTSIEDDMQVVKAALSDQAQSEEVQVERLRRLETVVSDHDRQLGDLRQQAA